MAGPERRQLRLTAAILIIAIILLSPPARPLRQQLVSLSQPLARTLYTIGIATSPLQPAAADGVLEAEWRVAQAKVVQLEAENAELRRAGQFPLANPLHTIGADVIGRSTESLRRTIRLNRGAEDGLQPEAAVLVDGWLIGKVVVVEATSAQVQLITDPDFRLTVTVGQSRLAALARGSLGALSVERLPLTETIAVGDAVLSSDLGGQVPSGLPLGTVALVSERDSVFHDITVDVPVQLETIRLVQVVVP